MARKPQSLTIKKSDKRTKLLPVLAIIAFILFLLRFPTIVNVLPFLSDTAKVEVIEWSVILFKVFIGLIVLFVGWLTLPVWAVLGIILLLIGAGMVVIGSIDVWRKTEGKERILND